MPSESPETTESDRESRPELAVDGRVVARLREIADISKSPADETAISTLFQRLIDAAAEDFEEARGFPPFEAVRTADPDPLAGNAETGRDPVPADSVADAD